MDRLTDHLTDHYLVDLKNILCCYNRGTCEFSRNNPHVFSKYYTACPCQGIPGKDDRFFYRVLFISEFSIRSKYTPNIESDCLRISNIILKPYSGPSKSHFILFWYKVPLVK